jgi:hypothetical protein
MRWFVKGKGIRTQNAERALLQRNLRKQCGQGMNKP